MDIPYTMDKKVCIIDIEDYKGELPMDLFQIDMFRDNDTKHVMKYSGDPFFKYLHCENSESMKTVCRDEKLQYILNNNYIFTKFETGKVEIAYLAIPLDGKGFPLIPDYEAFLKAAEYEIAYKIAYKEWINDKLTRDKFQYIEQQRNWYVAKAMNKPKVPDEARMEAIKNFTLRLIPKVNVLDERFKFHPEHRINHNTNNFSQGTKL